MKYNLSFLFIFSTIILFSKYYMLLLYVIVQMKIGPPWNSKKKYLFRITLVGNNENMRIYIVSMYSDKDECEVDRRVKIQT